MSRRTFFHKIVQKRSAQRLADEAEKIAAAKIEKAQKFAAAKNKQCQQAFMDKAELQLKTYSCTVKESSSRFAKRLPRYFKFDIQYPRAYGKFGFEEIHLKISADKDDFSAAEDHVINSRTLVVVSDKKVRLNGANEDDYTSFKFESRAARDAFVGDWNKLAQAISITTENTLRAERGNHV